MHTATCLVTPFAFIVALAVTPYQEIGVSMTRQTRQSVTGKQGQFIQEVNERIENKLSDERLSKWKELEDLQELEALKQLAKHKELTRPEKERLSALKQKQESIFSTQVVSNADAEKALRLSIDSSVLESYQALYEEWKKRPTEALFIQLSGAATLVAWRKDINSTVRITSQAEGATIKYQTLFERSKGLEPITAKQPTKCTETMPIGYYYIWSERNAKITSDMNSKFYVAAAEEDVTIVEKQP